MEKLTIQKALLEKRVELLNIRKGRDVELEEQSTHIDGRLKDILKASEKLADKNQVKAEFAVLHADSNAHLEERRKAKKAAKAAAEVEAAKAEAEAAKAEAEAAKAEASDKARGSWARVRATVIHDVHLKKDQLDAIRNFVDAGKKQQIKVDLKRRRDEKKMERQGRLTGVDTELTGIVDKIEEETEHNEEAEEAHAIALIQEDEATQRQLLQVANGGVAETKLDARRKELRKSIAKKQVKSDRMWPGMVKTAVLNKVTEILKKQGVEAIKLAEEAVLQQQEAFEADDKQADCEISRLEKRGGELTVLQSHLESKMREVPRLAAAAANFRLGDKSAPIDHKVTKIPQGHLAPLQPLSTDYGALNKELLEAAENGDITQLIRLLNQGANPNATDEDGKTPLHHAVEANSDECVRALLDKGAEINQADQAGATPLMVAAMYGNTEVIKLLLDNGANKNLKDNRGETALFHATNSEYGEDPEIAKMLSGDHTEEGEAEELERAAHSASLLSAFMTKRKAKEVAEQERVAAEAEAEAKRVQMEKEAEAERVREERLEDAEAEANRVREERLEELRRAADQASLIYAVMNKKGAAAKNTVEFKKAEDNRKITEEALIAEQERVAAEAEAARIAEEESLMDWNAVLINQAAKGDAEGVRRALNKGADPNSISSKGITALQHAAAADSVECLEVLLNAGTEINIVGEDNITALMQAAFSKSSAALKFLLEKKADWRLIDSDGKTALDYAYDSGEDSAIVKLGKWIKENGTQEEIDKLEKEVTERVQARIVEQRNQRVANDPEIQARRAAKALADAEEQRIADDAAWLKEYDAGRAAKAEAKKREIEKAWALREGKKAEEKAAREALIQADELKSEEKEERIQKGLAPSGRWYCSPTEKEVKANLTDLRGIVTLFVEEDKSAEDVVGVVEGEYDRRDNARTRSQASAAYPIITGQFFADNSLKLNHTSSKSNQYEWDIKFTEVDQSTAVDFKSSPVDKLTGTWSHFSLDRRSGGRALDPTEFVAYRLEDINEICGKMLEKVQTIAGVEKLLKDLGKLPKTNLKPCYYLTRYNFHHLNRKANQPYLTHDDRKDHADCLWDLEGASTLEAEDYFRTCSGQPSTPGGDVMINTHLNVDEQEGVVAQEFLYEPRLHGPNCKQKYMWDTLIEFINKGDMEQYILEQFGVDLSFIGFQAALTQFKEDMGDNAGEAFLGPHQFLVV